MDGALNVLVAFFSALGVLALWLLIVVVIPGVVVLYGVRIFPLTGQWRKRFKARFGAKEKR